MPSIGDEPGCEPGDRDADRVSSPEKSFSEKKASANMTAAETATADTRFMA
jgi:hypothetical protein